MTDPHADPQSPRSTSPRRRPGSRRSASLCSSSAVWPGRSRRPRCPQPRRPSPRRGHRRAAAPAAAGAAPAPAPQPAPGLAGESAAGACNARAGRPPRRMLPARGGAAGRPAALCPAACQEAPVTRPDRRGRRRIRRRLAVDRCSSWPSSGSVSSARPATRGPSPPASSRSTRTCRSRSGRATSSPARASARTSASGSTTRCASWPTAAALEHADACDAVLLATSAEVSMRLLPAFARARQAGRRPLGRVPPRGRRVPALVRLRARRAGLARARALRAAGARRARRRAAASSPTRAATRRRRCSRSRRSSASGLVEPAGLIVDAKSGVTGAGKQSGEAFSFAEYADDSHAYKLLAHQHTPEITRALSRFATGRQAHVHAALPAHQARPPRHLLRAAAARRDGARASPSAWPTPTRARGFVRAMAPDQVTLKRVVGTNACHVGRDRRRRRGRRRRRDRQPAQGRRRAGAAEPEPDERLGRDDGPRRVAARLAIAGMPA